MEEATKMVERASSEAFTSPSATTATTTQRNGVTTFQREYSNSSSSNGGTSTTYYRQVIITNTGAPPQGYAMQGPHMLPPLPLLALLAALAGAWFAATRRFLANYQCTLYVGCMGGDMHGDEYEFGWVVICMVMNMNLGGW